MNKSIYKAYPKMFIKMLLVGIYPENPPVYTLLIKGLFGRRAEKGRAQH